MKQRLIHFLCWSIVSIVLVACASDAVVIQPTTVPDQTDDQRAEQADTATEQSEGDVSVAGRLLYVQDGNIYLHHGTTVERLTNDGKSHEPDWSSDGQLIAAVRYDESFSDIFLLDVGSGRSTQVTDNGSDAIHRSEAYVHDIVWASAPTWTPNDESLVFLQQEYPSTRAIDDPPLYEFPLVLYRYPLSLLNIRPPTNADIFLRAEDADLQGPAWAPDGSVLAYVKVPRTNSPRRIMYFDPQTAATVPYPRIPNEAYDPVWSPDSRWLAFTAVVEGQSDIWAVPHPAIGGGVIRLTDTGRARAPEWSPDGSQLAFVQIGDKGSDVYHMSIETEDDTLRGGEVQQVTTSGRVDANSGLSWADD